MNPAWPPSAPRAESSGSVKPGRDRHPPRMSPRSRLHAALGAVAVQVHRPDVGRVAGGSSPRGGSGRGRSALGRGGAAAGSGGRAVRRRSPPGDARVPPGRARPGPAARSGARRARRSQRRTMVCGASPVPECTRSSTWSWPGWWASSRPCRQLCCSSGWRSDSRHCADAPLREWIAFATHAAFLALFAVIHRVSVLNARLALPARRAPRRRRSRPGSGKVEGRGADLPAGERREPGAAPGCREPVDAGRREAGGGSGRLGAAGDRRSWRARTHTCAAAFLLAPDDRTHRAPRLPQRLLSVQRGARSTPAKASRPGCSSARCRCGWSRRQVCARRDRDATVGRRHESVCAWCPSRSRAGSSAACWWRTGWSPSPSRTARGDAAPDARRRGAAAPSRSSGCCWRSAGPDDEGSGLAKAIRGTSTARANLDAVFGAVLDGARQLAGLDFAAICAGQRARGERQHRVACG